MFSCIVMVVLVMTGKLNTVLLSQAMGFASYFSFPARTVANEDNICRRYCEERYTVCNQTKNLWTEIADHTSIDYRIFDFFSNTNALCLFIPWSRAKLSWSCRDGYLIFGSIYPCMYLFSRIINSACKNKPHLKPKGKQVIYLCGGSYLATLIIMTGLWTLFV